MDATVSIDIDRPVEEVFDYTIHNVKEWSETVVSDEVIEEKPGVVGTRFRVVTEEKGNRMEFDGVVTRNEPPFLHTVFMEGKYFDIEAEYRFEDLGGRTRVTQNSTINGKRMFKLMFFLFGWMMRKANCDAQEKQFRNLKKMTEAR